MLSGPPAPFLNVISINYFLFYNLSLKKIVKGHTMHQIIHTIFELVVKL